MSEDGAVNQEVGAAVKDATPKKEVVREVSLNDFITYKTDEHQKAATASLAAVESGKVPLGTSPDILVRKESELREQVDMLNNLVNSRASDLKDQLYPDTPSFWEMNDAEKDTMRQKVKASPLTESVSWYGEVVDDFEKEYEEKHKGKSYRDMPVIEENEARDESAGLDKMHKLHNEMLNFTPPPSPKSPTT